jgi:tetratricopeptide (TPR) repeat protein
LGATLVNAGLWRSWLYPPTWLAATVAIWWLALWLTKRGIGAAVQFLVGYDLFWGSLIGILAGWTAQLKTAWLAYTLASVLGFFVGITQGAYQQRDMKHYDGWFMLGTLLAPLTAVLAVVLARQGLLAPTSLAAAAKLGALAGLAFLAPLAIMLAANWDNSRALIRLAALNLHHHETLANAAPMLGKAAKMRPSDPDVARLQAIAAGLAGEDAGGHWRRHLELQPRSIEPLVGEGVLRLRAGDVNGALEALEQAVKRQPKHARALTALASALRQAGVPERAIPLYEQALSLSPDALTMTRLAEAQFAAGRVKDAFQTAEGAITELDSTWGSTFLIRGRIHLARRHPNKAEEDFREAYDSADEVGVREAAEAALKAMGLEP